MLLLYVGIFEKTTDDPGRNGPVSLTHLQGYSIFKLYVADCFFMGGPDGHKLDSQQHESQYDRLCGT